MIYLKLFWELFKVSLFTYGGGFGAIALIRDTVLSNGWLTDEQVAHMIAISESTPGPIMVNMATYVGYGQAGFWGSIIATVAVVLPAYLVILLVLGILKNTIQNKYVQAVLRGLKPCVTGIVLATGLYMVIHNCFPGNWMPQMRAVILTGLLVIIMVLYPKITKKKLPSIMLILISAILGMIVYSI